MAHVVRAWRSSRIIRFIVLFGLLGTVVQVLLSRESGLLKSGTSQTRNIGTLVSVEKLPEMAGEFCETDGPATKEDVRMAALEASTADAALTDDDDFQVSSGALIACKHRRRSIPKLAIGDCF